MRRKASSRAVLVRLAANLPKGSVERRAVLARLVSPSGWMAIEPGKVRFEDKVGYYKFIKVHASRRAGNTHWVVEINWDRKDYHTWEGTSRGWPNIREAVGAAEKALAERIETLVRFRKGVNKLRAPLELVEMTGD